MTVDELVDLAAALFVDALARGDDETAGAAASICFDLTAEVAWAMDLLEGAGGDPGGRAAPART
jgi:hypothetical protein